MVIRRIGQDMHCQLDEYQESVVFRRYCLSKAIIFFISNVWFISYDLTLALRISFGSGLKVFAISPIGCSKSKVKSNNIPSLTFIGRILILKLGFSQYKTGMKVDWGTNLHKGQCVWVIWMCIRRHIVSMNLETWRNIWNNNRVALHFPSSIWTFVISLNVNIFVISWIFASCTDKDFTDISIQISCTFPIILINHTAGNGCPTRVRIVVNYKIKLWIVF